MLQHKWLKLAESNPVVDFVDTLLRGYSQIIFCNSAAVGIALLAGFIDSPVCGITSLISSITSLLTALLLKTPQYNIKSGLYVWNSALTGFALASFLSFDLNLLILALAGGILSALLTDFLNRRLSLRYNLPVLSIPFVLVSWLLLIIAHYLPAIGGEYLTTLDIFQKGRIEVLLLPLLPSWLGPIFHVMSAIFLQNSIIIGVIVLICILFNSRISAVFALAGAIIGIALYYVFVPLSGSYANESVIGFNCALICIALGGFFIRLTWQGLIYAALGTLAGAIAAVIFNDIDSSLGMPALAAPFNLVTLAFLFIIRTLPGLAGRVGLIAIPLEIVGKPEANFSWRYFTGSLVKKQIARLMLPFYGTWQVSNGNFSHPTHVGVSSYAWDFIVLDESGRSFNGTGKSNEDFYCFGLPIVAPADGRVVKAVDSIPDNTPPGVNMDYIWGNHVIIDHGNEEYSEISHLLQFSLKVKEGEAVKGGQLLGYCGNSGFSYSPHIHFQLQKVGTTGAQSVPAKFSKYTVHRGPSRTSVSEGIPKRSERVSNPLPGT